MKKRVTSFLGIAFVILLLAACKTSSDVQLRETGVTAENGIVASAHPLASQVGVDIMKAGGNAFDAAVATQFALAVVYPVAGNIGGGGFAVIRTHEGEKNTLDYRERAPLTATRDMYLDDNGDVIPEMSTLGHWSAGVPGTVDGMVELHLKYGQLEWKKLVQPAIDLAHDGFALTKKEAHRLNDAHFDFLKVNTSSMPLINDDLWVEDDIVELPELAKTLRRVRDYKRDGFYSGVTASLLLSEFESGGAKLSQQDLDEYSSVWRDPLEGYYRWYNVISMPPPSSGGLALLQLLYGTTPYKIADLGHNTDSLVHLMTELERRVYADRARHLGDPDHYHVPVAELLDPDYLSSRFSDISWDHATPSSDVRAGDLIAESMETTHFSIVDKLGNAVSITTTLNGAYGSKVMVDGAGFLLNNEMDDFSIKPGVPNMYGLIGGEANAIAPGKRMLSSMTPTILERDGKLFMVLGSPGGSTIITSVYQTILNVVDHGMDIQQAVDARRVHHQWLPEEIKCEEGALSEEIQKSLTDLGHTINEVSGIGRVDAILIDADGLRHGAGDSRGDDTAIGY